MDPYTDSDPEYKATPLVSPIPPPSRPIEEVQYYLHNRRHSKNRQHPYHGTSHRNQPYGSRDDRPRHPSSYSRPEETRPPPQHSGHQMPRHHSTSRQSHDTNPNYNQMPEVVTRQTVEWLSSNTSLATSDLCLEVKKNVTIDYDLFGNEDLAKSVLDSKTKLNTVSKEIISIARSKSNMYERIGKSIFINRAAVKMAEIDMLSGVVEKMIAMGKIDSEGGVPRMVYFADICGGPGGFSEYILWRTAQTYKTTRCHGFGMTLNDERDFRLQDFNPESQCNGRYQVSHGADETGNVCKLDNIRHFESMVMKGTSNRGVDLVLSDGGISVEGNELHQEVLTERLKLSEVLIALSILAEDGDFVLKVYDVYRPFMVALLYVIYKHFEKVAIVKPFTSRPANSERYLICRGFKGKSETIVEHLVKVSKEMSQSTDESDMVEFIQTEKIAGDEKFVEYIRNINMKHAVKQLGGLKNLLDCIDRLDLPVNINQDYVRKKCLQDWKLPSQ